MAFHEKLALGALGLLAGLAVFSTYGGQLSIFHTPLENILSSTSPYWNVLYECSYHLHEVPEVHEVLKVQ
ncbi:hypothetical protein RCIA35 [Methanocella arvoryzae MRE50]|uniref:Uncharacterized protein n=1 Tax=Methanocella arvoryzae (strain DSM 22066 / NBRC 105507 / MRE50) TaxID=351160 RepID=Q0W685_METAR|nr:hypothetical protein orf16 [uncultured archaeon]CAJ36108.1 hypothetical protein RCIA35 [Methanocella arvoryzae MRE50]